MLVGSAVSVYVGNGRGVLVGGATDCEGIGDGVAAVVWLITGCGAVVAGIVARLVSVA